MRLAQKMIVGGALLLDRVANSHLHRLGVIAESVPNRTLSGIEEGGARISQRPKPPSLSGSDGQTQSPLKMMCSQPSDGVPEDDGDDREVEAGGTVALVFEGAVPDISP